MGLVVAFIRHESRLSAKEPIKLMLPLFFAGLMAVLFPLALGEAKAELQTLAPAILMMIILISSLLATDGLYREDYEDGSLVLQHISPISPYFFHMLKVFVYWLRSGFLLSVISPVLGLLLDMPIDSCLIVLLTLMLASIVLIFIGAIGAALTLSLKQAGLLMLLLVLPLYVPVLILSVATLNSALGSGLFVTNYLALLGACALLSITLAPFAIAGAITINIEAM